MTTGAMRSASAQPQPDSVGTAISLELNIPANRLDLFRGGNWQQSYSVAVGLPRYPTPLGDFAITQIAWNPWWYPPKSDWARHEKITQPGPQNPMGKVKLLLGGSFYLHATPFQSSIGRAASHGCVRMRTDDAVALARLLQNVTRAAMSDAAVDSLISSWSETRVVDLPVAIPVRVVYRLAEARGDSLLLHPDIYGLRLEDLEAAALRELAKATFDTSRVDRGALRRLLRRARSEHVRQLIRNLVAVP